MSARDKLPAAPAETPRDRADKHDLRIHRAKQLCRPVLYRGVKEFVATFCHHKGDAGMVVYLEGSAEPVRPCDITIIEEATL